MQRYAPDPLLLNGYKFDLRWEYTALEFQCSPMTRNRVYVLVSATGEESDGGLAAYVCNEVRADSSFKKRVNTLILQTRD